VNILIIEDHKKLALQMSTFFEGHSWYVDIACNAREGVELALKYQYDVIVLDLGLPDEDGLQVCLRIKAQVDYNVPVIMLTARDSFEDKSLGFESGADDYLTKPCDLRELALRCKAISRRKELYQKKEISLNELLLDKVAQRVFRDNIEIDLSKTSFNILLMLVQAYPQPVSRNKILHELWGNDLPETNVLKAHIYNLRTALDKPFEQNLIKTVVNVGYKLEFSDND
jgi:DNA-binding response OmpR family regulator